MDHSGRLLGCIADDFTGASDAASFLQKAGMETILLNGTPQAPMELRAFDAVVIALKTRTEPVRQAVAESMAALKWLQACGATHYYIKYCSTFDSTPQGNIGPVLDAALAYFQEPYTILCPALPVNGRTVVNGHLYVNGVPLNESPMKDHPLTPMWDSRIKHLMERQSLYPCYEISQEALSQPALPQLAQWQNASDHFYLIPDYQSWDDGENIARLFQNCKILSGGSGILAHLWRKTAKGILLAGSCSKATLGQIAAYQKEGHPSIKLDPFALMQGQQTWQQIWGKVQQSPDGYVLVYASDTAQNVKRAQQLGKEAVAALLEQTLAALAAAAVEAGYQHIIVAGGETSGAVTRKLGYRSFQIGKSVAPGVPVMTPLENRDLRLVLKSGNFGQEDFFQRAIEAVRGE